MSAPSHRAAAPASVSVAVLTVSDTRGPEDDPSGDYLATALEAAGHAVADRAHVRDEPADIQATVQGWLDDPAVQVVLTTGGTGITKRDSTVDVLAPLLDVELPGFGELFRYRSYHQVGGAAMLTRATGGVAAGTLLFVLPGSKNAVQTAWDELLAKDLAHLVWELGR